jgi:peptide/nickel transport system ATP-binding protein
MELLQVQDLALDYRSHRGTVHALDGVSLSMAPGEMLGLVGESGCGKTSLARALTGVLPGNARITRGRILWQGRDLLTLSDAEHRQLRWREFAFVPQSAMNALNPVQRVSTQLMEVLRERSTLKPAQASERLGELFDQVGIDRKRLTDYPHQFSGGMRQRISIAMALAAAAADRRRAGDSPGRHRPAADPGPDRRAAPAAGPVDDHGHA